MKVHCDGLKGWWETCPVIPDQMPTDVPFTSAQTQAFTTIGIAFMVVVFVLILMIFVATLPDR